MKEIQRISVADAVAESIKELICTGKYAVGQKLPTEAKFCEELHVSRTSVREYSDREISPDTWPYYSEVLNRRLCEIHDSYRKKIHEKTMPFQNIIIPYYYTPNGG